MPDFSDTERRLIDLLEVGVNLNLMVWSILFPNHRVNQL